MKNMEHVQKGFLFSLGLLPLAIFSVWLFHGWPLWTTGSEGAAELSFDKSQIQPGEMKLTRYAVDFSGIPNGIDPAKLKARAALAQALACFTQAIRRNPCDTVSRDSYVGDLIAKADCLRRLNRLREAVRYEEEADKLRRLFKRDTRIRSEHALSSVDFEILR